MPNEMDKLVQFIFQQDAMVISERSKSPEPFILKNSNSIKHKGFICPYRLISEIKFNKIADEIYYVDFTTSPVIEFSLSVDRGESISRGKLYIQFGYDGRNGWFSYHESLAQLHKRIVYFLKKEILTKEKCFLAYCSKVALDFQRTGGELVQL